MKGKKIFSLLLAALICVTAVLGNGSVSKAAAEMLVADETGSTAANTECTYNFTVKKSTDVYLEVVVPDVATTCRVAVYDNGTDSLYGQGTITSTDWQYDADVSAYYYDMIITDMAAGDYTAQLLFDVDTQYQFYAGAKKIEATLNKTKATITAGFTTTIKVDNSSDKVTWSSSKKSVATVSSKGVVTGKKAGTATITAKVGDQKLTCKITVKANTYSEAKKSVSNVRYGYGDVQVYKASYASNGDLTLKCRFINNRGLKSTALKNLKITFVTAEGKTIGTYSGGTKKMSVSHGSTKDFTVTIKKSKLKIKKADLRSAKYSVDGMAEYTYY